MKALISALSFFALVTCLIAATQLTRASTLKTESLSDTRLVNVIVNGRVFTKSRM